jgi:hypothetical protein
MFRSAKREAQMRFAPMQIHVRRFAQRATSPDPD